MIAIAGYGFVGKAHYEVFKNHFELEIVDPSLCDRKIVDVPNLVGVICCVGTPTAADGSCDATHVLEVIQSTPEHVPILIKSTISLDVWKQIIEKYPDRKIAFSPEFLRASQAVLDLSNSNMIIISGSGVNFWRTFYKKRFPNAKIHLYSAEEAIMIKYFRNSFLATKVSFFNQIFDFCKQHDINFDCVRQGVADDFRIGHSHSFIESDYSRGWAGICFPKDTAALLKMADDKKVELSIIKEAVDYNNKIRKS
jgi:UDPglucose 6-dehydrogenase